MFHSLLYFNHRADLVFELPGDSCLEVLLIITSNCTQDRLLLTVLVLTGISSCEAKLSFITSLLFGVSVVLTTLFSDVLQLFIEVVDKLFESLFVFWL